MKMMSGRSSRRSSRRSSPRLRPKNALSFRDCRPRIGNARPKPSTRRQTATPKHSRPHCSFQRSEKKIETALGRRLSDAQLRALIDNNRTEAVYWYGYAQSLGVAHGAANGKPGG